MNKSIHTDPNQSLCTVGTGQSNTTPDTISGLFPGLTREYIHSATCTVHGRSLLVDVLAVPSSGILQYFN